MKLSQIPTLVPLPFANSGQKNAIPTASQIGITAGAASLTDGFPPLTFTAIAAGGVPPSGEDMNGILNLLSQNTMWNNAGGFYPYNATFSTAIGGYPNGALLARADGTGFWLSTVDNNATDPETDTSGAWYPVGNRGISNVVITSANVTLSPTQYGPGVILLTGALTTNLQVYFPTIAGLEWLIINQTTGAFSVTAKTTAGTGLIVAQNSMQRFYGDGTNLVPTLVYGQGIASGTVTGGNIASGTVTGGNIAGSTITEGNIAGGAIHRAQLSTATAGGNMAVGSAGNAVYYLAGGNFSMWTYSGNSAGTGSGTDISLVPGAPGQGAGAIGIYNASTNGTTGTFYIQENYINSSPPYNFGESFVYVAYDAQGKIVGISAALDPTWAHHGSHSIVPKHWREVGTPGTKGYQLKPMVWHKSLDGISYEEGLKDPRIARAYMNGEIKVDLAEFEITLDWKDADKETHSHPFGSDSVARVVMLSPDCPLAERITEMLKYEQAATVVKWIENAEKSKTYGPNEEGPEGTLRPTILMGKTGIIHPNAPSTIQVCKAKVR